MGIRIDLEPAYKIKYNYRGKRRYNIFATKKAAVKRVAWWMIQDKHAQFPGFESPFDDGPRALPNGLECGCDYEDYREPAGSPWEYCEIHSREDGYFMKVHQRLVRFILNKEQL